MFLGDLNRVINRKIIIPKEMIRKITTTILALLFFVGSSVTVSAQMTNDEILTYAKQAIASGKSTDVLVQELAAKGVTVQQLQELQSEVNGSAGTLGFTSTLSAVGGQERLRRIAGTMNSDIEGLEHVADRYVAMNDKSADNEATTVTTMKQNLFNGNITQDTCRIFGHNIFRQQSLTFAPNENIATPENYKLGPGDEIFIDIWGANKASIRETISPDGFIIIDNYGLLPLNGLTIKEAEKFVRKQLGRIYSLSGSDAQSDMKLSLGAVRTINVNVMGEVTTPGTYYMSSMPNTNHQTLHFDSVKMSKVRLPVQGKSSKPIHQQ